MMDRQELLEILHTVHNYNIKLISALNGVVEDLRGQNEADGLKILVEAIEGIEWSISAALASKRILAQYGLIINENTVTGTLKQIVGSLENNDYVLLPDLIEFEILDFLNRFQGILKLILNEANNVQQ